jgi:Cys-tRNA(Pro) deacylase
MAGCPYAGRGRRVEKSRRRGSEVTDHTDHRATAIDRGGEHRRGSGRRLYDRAVPKHPVTMAIRALRAADVAFVPHLYAWHARGGTRASSDALGVDEHAVVKTLIFETERGDPLCVLMHGDREVSAKQLARVIGTKTVAPCAPEVADRHSGYQVGGTSPFGLRRAMPIYLQTTVLALPRIYLNGGARGFLVEIDPREVERVLKPMAVEVAVS